MVMTQFIEIGPEGEKVDRMLYQTKWKEKIQEVAAQHPEIVEAAQTNNFTDDMLDFINSEVLNRPNDYFNVNQPSQGL